MIFPLELIQSFESEEQRIEFMEAFGRCAWVREELVKYLELRLSKIQAEDDSIEHYNCPNLSELRADQRGQRRMLREFINLLKGDNQNGRNIGRTFQLSREEKAERQNRRREERNRQTRES